MMKKLYPFLLVLATPIVLLLMSNSNGSPGGRTGSVGDNGNTCNGCHSGNVTTMTGWISTNIPAEGYTPGTTYTITATGTHTGVVKFGFELTVENSTGAKVGTLQLSDPARTKLVNAGKAVSHTSSGTTPFGNTNSWSVQWVAPANIEGQVGIYAAFNAANGNGNTNGDVIYKSSLFVSEFVPQPMLVSIEPDSALQGETVVTLITAVNSKFTEGFPQIFLSSADNPFETITASLVNVLSDITAEATFIIPESATAGLWDLHADNMLLENTFTVLLLSDIQNFADLSVKIYPNPSFGKFYVDQANGAVLTILGSNGQILGKEKIVSDHHPVRVSGLVSGVYFLNLERDGLKITRKLLVN